MSLAFMGALAAPVACSDDDGGNVPRKGPITGGGGSAGAGAAGGSDTADAGLGGASGSAGAGGGSSGTGGSGMGGSEPECVPPDAGPPLDAGLDASADASTDGGPVNRLVSFEADIWPLFTSRCGDCHTTGGYAGHNVGSPDLAEAYADAVEEGIDLVDRLNGGGMPPENAAPPNNCGYNPPGSPGCFSVAEIELIRTWIEQCKPL